MSAYSDRVLADGAAGYWRLGESAGTVAVDAKGLHNGAYTAAPTLGVAGLLTGDTDKALQVNGVTGQGVDLGDFPEYWLTTLTLEAWIKAPAPGASFRSLIVKQYAAGLFLIDGVLAVYDWVAGAARSSGVNVADGLRHHVAVVIVTAANSCRFYVDGQPVGATFSYTSTAQAGRFYIGYYAGGGGQEFSGVIDEVGIYPSALSAATLLAHYQLGSTGSLPANQTVQVGGVYPSGYQASIVGRVTSGDGHVVGGRSLGTQFGTPLVAIKLVTPVSVGGVASAAVFGTVTIKATFPKLRPAGVGSAQQFGAVTVALMTVPQTRPVSGVGSAQTFGSLLFRVTLGSGGVLSAQLFGAVAVRTVSRVTVAGVGSASLFGVPHIAFWQPLPQAGVPSAQRFGRPFVANLLQVSVCTPLTTVAVACQNLTGPAVGCATVTVTTTSDTALTVTPSSCVPLILVDADV